MLVSRRLGGSRPIGRPPIRMSPSSTVSKPPIARRVVVLPHPDGPRSEKNSPARTVNDTASTATTAPKRFVIARTSRSAPRDPCAPDVPIAISRRGGALHPGLDLLLPARAPLARLLAHHAPVEPDRAVDHLRVERRVHLLGERRGREGWDLVRELGVPRVVLRRRQLVDDLLGDRDLLR